MSTETDRQTNKGEAKKRRKEGGTGEAVLEVVCCTEGRVLRLKEGVKMIDWKGRDECPRQR